MSARNGGHHGAVHTIHTTKPDQGSKDLGSELGFSSYPQCDLEHSDLLTSQGSTCPESPHPQAPPPGTSMKNKQDSRREKHLELQSPK